MELIRPAQGGPTEEVQVSPVEADVARLPFICSSYPVYCFGFVQCPSLKVLTSSLAEVLSTWRLFAGRFSKDGKSIVLNDYGVPFIVRSEVGPLPDSGDEVVLRTNSIPDPTKVACGRGPLLVVSLTQLSSGAGVLSIARSHGAADGATIAAFVRDWAKAANGQDVEPLDHDRSEYFFAGASVEEAVAEVSRIGGLEVAPKARPRWRDLAISALFRAACRVEGALMRCGCPLPTSRTRALFSHCEMAHIKKRASEGLTRVPWITTQEAFFAHLMLTIPKSLGKGPIVGLVVFCQAKKALGKERLCSGCLFSVSRLKFNVAGKTLGALAEEVHLELQHWLKECLVDEVRAGNGCAQYRLMPSGDPFKDCDHVLVLNNQSKVPLVDFGTGQAEWLAASSGPSVMLPHRDGVCVFFDHMRTLPVTKENEAAVVDALHCIDGEMESMVPSAAAGA